MIKESGLESWEAIRAEVRAHERTGKRREEREERK